VFFLKEAGKLIKWIRSNQLEFVILILVLLFFTLLTTTFALHLNELQDIDLTLHLKYAELYAQGQNAMYAFSDTNNGLPYPPLFHLLLAAFIVLGVIQQAVTVMMILFFPLILLLFFLVVCKLSDAKTATIFLLCVVSSTALFDRGMQVNPQAIDFLCLPLALYFFFKNRDKLFLLAVSIPIYSHSGYGFLILLSFTGYSLLFNYKKDLLKWSWLLAAPMLILVLLQLPQAFQYAAAESNAQNIVMKQFFFQGIMRDAFPLTYTGLGVLLGVLLLVCAAVIWKLIGKGVIKDLFDSELSKWAACFFGVLLLILPFFADRFVSYAAIPLSLLIALFARKLIWEKESGLFVYSGFIIAAIVSWIVGIQFFLR
jgi:hypothetical protein